MIETIDKIFQWLLYAVASGFMLMAFPFMLLSFRQRLPAPAPKSPRIRAFLPARTETVDFEIVDDERSL